MSNLVNWPGKSGKTYGYYYYTIGHKLQAKPGNYIFVKIVNNEWVPVYIGETEDLDQRIATHEKRECARRNGASHIHVHLAQGIRQMRLDEETDLRQNFNPACNRQ